MAFKSLIFRNSSFLLICLLFSFVELKNSLAEEKKTPKLMPFTTDGCSVVPDFNFVNCCKIHDLHYWAGGTEEQRLAADEEFYQCILKETGIEAVASVYYWGVREFGGPNPENPYAWGYGWEPRREEPKELSSEDLISVQQIAPEDPTKIPITPPISIATGIRASQCENEIASYIASKTPDARIIRIVKKSDHYRTILRVYTDKDQLYRFYYSNKNFEACLEAKNSNGKKYFHRVKVKK